MSDKNKEPIMTDEMIEESFSHVIKEYETVTLDSMPMVAEQSQHSYDKYNIDTMLLYPELILPLPRRRGSLPNPLSTRSGKSLYVCPEDRDKVSDLEDRIDHRIGGMGLASGFGLSTALQIARTADNPLVYVTDSETNRATTSRTNRGLMPRFVTDDWMLSLDNDEFATPRHWEKHIPRVRKSVSENRDSKISVPDIHYHNVTDHLFRVLRHVRPSLSILTRMMLAIRRRVPLSHIDANDEMLYGIKSDYPHLEDYRRLYTGKSKLKFNIDNYNTPFKDYIQEDDKVYMNYLKERDRRNY